MPFFARSNAAFWNASNASASYGRPKVNASLVTSHNGSSAWCACQSRASSSACHVLTRNLRSRAKRASSTDADQPRGSETYGEGAKWLDAAAPISTGEARSFRRDEARAPPPSRVSACLARLWRSAASAEPGGAGRNAASASTPSLRRSCGSVSA